MPFVLEIRMGKFAPLGRDLANDQYVQLSGKKEEDPSVWASWSLGYSQFWH